MLVWSCSKIITHVCYYCNRKATNYCTGFGPTPQECSNIITLVLSHCKHLVLLMHNAFILPQHAPISLHILLHHKIKKKTCFHFIQFSFVIYTCIGAAQGLWRSSARSLAKTYFTSKKIPLQPKEENQSRTAKMVSWSARVGIKLVHDFCLYMSLDCKSARDKEFKRKM